MNDGFIEFHAGSIGHEGSYSLGEAAAYSPYSHSPSRTLTTRDPENLGQYRGALAAKPAAATVLKIDDRRNWIRMVAALTVIGLPR